MRSRYAFLFNERMGALSSFELGEINVPNQVIFFSFDTWKNKLSSSSYWARASSYRPIPSNKKARLSWEIVSRVGVAADAKPYLENKKRAEIPPRHLPLAFGPFDFLFPKRDNSIECT